MITILAEKIKKSTVNANNDLKVQENNIVKCH